MTEIESARKGILTDGVRQVADREGVRPEDVAADVAAGRTAICRHRDAYAGVGRGLRTKVNTNIGTSPDLVDVPLELVKLDLACRHKTDAVMDLSTGGDLDAIRAAIVARSTVPVGTVPVYQAAVEAIERRGGVVKMDPDRIFETIERHAEDGVAFVTVHCGINRRTVERLRSNPRETMVVSRGGVFLVCWMIANDAENPLFADFGRLLEIARKHDLVLSLGDGMRPGSIADATDPSQIEELLTLGELARTARAENVQVIIEGPGHVPLDEISANIQLEKKLCDGAPFYVLGPLVTDVAPGYDHITGAVGGAIAGAAGADFLCYVTPSEHLGLPGPDEVVEGLIATRIAAHAADLVKGVPGAREWDLDMGQARRRRDWAAQKALSVDPDRFEQLHRKRTAPETDVCTMCGKFCALKLVEDALGTRMRS